MNHLKKRIVMKSQKILTIEANFDLSENVVNFFMENYGEYFPSVKLNFQINMIIDEIFGNISRYAFTNEGGKINILSWIEEDPLSLNIKFIDNGVPFNPLEIENPDITSSVDNRKIGGLGIFIVKSMVDSFVYKYIHKCNVLTITKVLN